MNDDSMVGIRELRQNLSKYLRRVMEGETLRVTDRGRAVAVFAPLPEQESVVARLERAGHLVRARIDLATLGPPADRQQAMSISEALADQRAEDEGLANG